MNDFTIPIWSEEYLSQPEAELRAVTFPCGVSNEPCDGVLLVMDDGSEIPVKVNPGRTVLEVINHFGEWISTHSALNLPGIGRIIPTRRIVDVFAIVGGKAIGRG